MEVVPDPGGHGQKPLGDADGDAVEGTATVLFQVKLAFEGVVDRLDELTDLLQDRGAPAFLLGLLLGQVGKQMADLLAGGTDPLTLRIVSEHHLGHSDGHQFGVREPGWSTHSGLTLQLVVDLHVECGQEGVQVCLHKLTNGHPPPISIKPPRRS